jgi:hypothetical protein
MALYHLKASGEFDAAVQEWENRPAGQKTWQNIKTFISAEYAKENKQNKLTAKNFKANMIEEQAEGTEELIATLTEKHTQQMESVIKSTTEAMKEMMALIKNEKKEPNNQLKDEKKKKREEKCKKYNDAPVCKNCGKKQSNQINQLKETQTIVTTKTNKWTRRIERRQAMKLVFDSGATSHFVPEEMNLPRKGKSNKEVFLPDNTKLQASFTTELPF